MTFNCNTNCPIRSDIIVGYNQSLSQLSLHLVIDMSLQVLSNPSSTFNPPLVHPGRARTVSIWNSAPGSCNLAKWVSSSQKNLGNCGKIFPDPRSNFGFWDVGTRMSKGCFSFRNNDGLLRVRCGGLEKASEEDAYYIRRCVELARQAVGHTSPNPMVGCVIVKDGKVVGEGYHPKAGQPHAEVFALRNAGGQAENATAYVSLEPCNHYGRTPPCTEALINAKVKKVVVGMVDPNPLVSSKGINRLKEAGIEVTVGIEEDLCNKLNEAFIHKMLSGNAFVTIRYSICINGMLLDQLGDEAMDCGGYYSKLLQEYDAVIHPPTKTTQEFSFSVSREPNACQPLHIFLTKDRKTPIRILKQPTEADQKAMIFTDKEIALEPEMSQMGIETVVLNQLSLHAILEYCSKQGFCNVLVDLRGSVNDLEEILIEGLEKSLMQKIVVEVLPLWTAGEGTDSSSAMKSITQVKRLKNLSSMTSGNSVLLEGYF